LTRVSTDIHGLSWKVVASLYSMHDPQPNNAEDARSDKGRVAFPAEQPFEQPVSVQAAAIPLPASGLGYTPKAPIRPRTDVEVHPSAVAQPVTHALPVDKHGDTPAEADGATALVPVSNSPTQSAGTLPPTSSSSIGMGALALAQQAKREKHAQSSQPATQSQPGTQALTPPGLGE
jgi:hypothetical protein